MTSGKQRDNVLQHPGKAALRGRTERSRQPHSEAVGRGATIFAGYIRSYARTKAKAEAKAQTEAQEGQEAWQQDFPPSAA